MPSASIGGYNLSYSFNGAGEREDGVVLVLVHGAGGREHDWPQAWRSLNDLTRSMGLTPQSHSGLLDTFPIYSLDLPGHGQSGGASQQSVDSYADAVAEFLSVMKFKKVILIGHSMGSAITLTLGVRGNAQLAGLVLIGGASKLVVSEEILTGLQTAFEATVDNIIKYSWFKQTMGFFKQKGRQRMLEAGSQVVYNDYFACSQFDLSGELDKVSLPTLVIASDHDRMVPVANSRSMADALADSRLVILEDCGHFQHIEKTNRVAEEITTFLEQRY